MANSSRDKHKARAYNFQRREARLQGKEGMGSPGDIRDRFRDAYKPGAMEAPNPPGLMSPMEAIRRLRKRTKRRDS